MSASRIRTAGILLVSALVLVNGGCARRRALRQRVAATSVTASPDTASFSVAGTRITYERRLPSSAGRHPLVVLLHGSAGPTLEDPYERPMADSLVAHGFAVARVHYFERTGTRFANPREDVAHFVEWGETIAAAITELSRDPMVDSTRVGLLGVSLGAYLALAEGSRDSRVDAVVEFAGGMPPRVVSGMTRMPPVLIVHGTADRLVPISNAYALDSLLTARHVEHTLQIYPGQGHGLRGADRLDAIQRMLRFFERYLQ